MPLFGQQRINPYFKLKFSELVHYQFTKGPNQAIAARESKLCPRSFCSYQSIWQLSKRGDFVSGPYFVKIAKSVMKSRFCAISFDFCDFTRFQPDFTHFWFFQAIQPVMHVLTRKIVRFYESKRDFNNLVHNHVCIHYMDQMELYNNHN